MAVIFPPYGGGSGGGGGGIDSSGARGTLSADTGGAQGWLTALANRQHETARVAVIGTSNTKGDQLTHWDDRFVNRLQFALREQWDTPTEGGIGWITAYGDGTQYDRRSTTGTWNSQDGGGFGYAGATAAATMTFQVPKGTSVELRYRNRQTGSFTWAVDGGTATQVDVTGTSSAPKYYLNSLSIPLPADDNAHSITVAWVSGEVQVQGVVHYDGDEASGIQVGGFGQSGQGTDNFVDDDFGLAYVSADQGVSLVALEFQGNDISAGNDKAAYKANLEAIMAIWDSRFTEMSTPLPSYLLMSASPATDYQEDAGYMAIWQEYFDARNEIAQANPTRVFTAMYSDWMPVYWTDTSANGRDPISGMPNNMDLLNSLLTAGHWKANGHGLVADMMARHIGSAGQIDQN